MFLTIIFQVSVLNAQVSAQQEKITELETITAAATNGAAKKHLNGSAIENASASSNGNDSRNGTLSNGASAQHRLDLLSEISTLRVRLASAENANRDWEAKYSALQVC